MIIIGVGNIIEECSLVVELIKQHVENRGESMVVIAPDKAAIYISNKKVSLKEYCQQFAKKNVDVLLLEINQNGLENKIYERIDFDAVVILDEKCQFGKIIFERGICARCRMMAAIKSTYYIVPEHWQLKKQGLITYGWSKEADFSISSVQDNIDGITEIQCCLETCIPSLKGNMLLPGEFSLKANIENVQHLLATVALMVLYGYEV